MQSTRGVLRGTAALCFYCPYYCPYYAARAAYESSQQWNGRVLRASVGERPHPAIRGYMPSIQEERGEMVKVWVDGCVRGDGTKAYAWMVAANGEMVKGGRKLEGEMTNLEVEGWAVWQGILEGINRRGQIGAVKVFTDSKQTVRQIGNYENRRWVIGKIQTEIARGLERGVLVRVEWRRRREDGIRVVDRECKRLVREDGEGERVNGVSKGFVRRWRREWEMNEWQRQWDEGTTGRWLHGMWGRVNRTGADVSFELTQVATGHGDFGTYLRRFRLDGGRGEGCECGAEDESVQHVVLECEVRRRVRARDRLAAILGHYPPRLGEVEGRQWGEVLEWAKGLMTEDG